MLINLCGIRRYKYYDITSTTLDALISQFWHISAFLENNPDKFSYVNVNKVQPLGFPMDFIQAERVKYKILNVLFQNVTK